MKAWRTYLNLREWPLAAFIVLAVVIGNVLAVTYYFSYSQIRDSDKWVAYTQGNIAAVLEFSTALQDAIATQQTYLSLGRQDYRAQAIEKLDQLPAALKPVLERVHHENSQNAMAEMEFELEALRKMSNQFIAARTRGDLAKAFDPKSSESFFTLARHIQQNADDVRDRERRLLDARQARALHSQNYYISMMLIASLFSLALVVTISWLLLKLRNRQTLVERELREARERLDLAIKGTSDGVWDWNPRTNDIYFSQRLREMYGYSAQELPNKAEILQALIHPEDLASAMATVKQYLAREIPRYESILRVKHKDNSWRWVMSRGAASWDRNGVATRMVGVHTDITSIKRMEEELREAKSRADSANRAKTTFLANMSHEIRTPMNAIIGIAEIMRRKTTSDGRDREYIDALHIASRSLFELINDLLDLSKLDDGSLLLEQVAFDPRQLFEETATMARVRAEEKNIALLLEISPKLPPSLIGDSHRLRQVVTNLLSNAVKFTEHGSVTLIAGVTPIGHIEIRVKDTGMGIPRAARKSIFEKFTQSDPSITRRFGGTGLGLSICRELVELMGGEIDVISTEGKGAEFIVTLPLPAATSVSVEAVAMAPAPVVEHTRGVVLLVEDYKPNVLVARTVLSSLGFGCEVAVNGKEAQDKLCAPTHDGFVAVLMDVQLPDITGVEVTQRVRSYEADQKAHHLPIIAMTAHAMMGDREKFLAAGMDAYIAKPFDPDDLTDKLFALALPVKTEKRKANRRKPAA